MRKLTSHFCEGKVAVNVVEATDDVGSGGANHRYEISGFDTDKNPSATSKAGYKASFTRQLVIFQNGPINESGVNGVQNEDLLAIIIDRLQGFQSGQFACRENAIALAHLQDAMHWLQHRTRERVARGVEGTHGK